MFGLTLRAAKRRGQAVCLIQRHLRVCTQRITQICEKLSSVVGAHLECAYRGTCTSQRRADEGTTSGMPRRAQAQVNTGDRSTDWLATAWRRRYAKKAHLQLGHEQFLSRSAELSAVTLVHTWHTCAKGTAGIWLVTRFAVLCRIGFEPVTTRVRLARKLVRPGRQKLPVGYREKTPCTTSSLGSSDVDHPWH